MGPASTPLPVPSRRSGGLGLLLAGGILFVLAFGGSSLFLGSDCGTGHASPTDLHGRA